MDCKHENFEARVEVTRIEDTGLFAADVTIKCRDCWRPFCFEGLPMGVKQHGATVGAFGLEARLAIVPLEEKLWAKLAS